MLVDDRDELLGAAAAPLVEAMSQTVPDAGVVTGEIYVDQVELNTPVCRSAEDAWRSLRDSGSRRQGGRTDPRRGGAPDRVRGGPAHRDVAALRPHHRRVRRPAAHAHRGPAGARRAARRAHDDAGLPRAAQPAAAPACPRRGIAVLARAGLGRGRVPGSHHPLLPPHHDAAAAAVVGRTSSARRRNGGGRGVRPHLRVVGDASATPARHPRGAGDGRRPVAVDGRRADRPGAGHRRRAVESPDQVDLEDDVLAVNDHRAARTASTRGSWTSTGRCGPARDRRPGGRGGADRAGRRPDGGAARRARAGSPGRPSRTVSDGWSRPEACRPCWPTSSPAPRTWTAEPARRGSGGLPPRARGATTSRRSRRPRRPRARRAGRRSRG